jgi:hypothetical protein
LLQLLSLLLLVLHLLPAACPASSWPVSSRVRQESPRRPAVSLSLSLSLLPFPSLSFWCCWVIGRGLLLSLPLSCCSSNALVNALVPPAAKRSRRVPPRRLEASSRAREEGPSSCALLLLAPDPVPLSPSLSLSLSLSLSEVLLGR